jgi:hypothetical protein
MLCHGKGWVFGTLERGEGGVVMDGGGVFGDAKGFVGCVGRWIGRTEVN